MALLFWDASALVKRYFVELGSITVDEVFAHSSAHDLATTAWGYAETYSVLLRRLNDGTLDLATFTTAVTSLQAEVVSAPDFGLLPVNEAHVFASIVQMRMHNLNATDAAILSMLLEYMRSLPPGSPACVLVASDKRLVRAANGEGLRTLDPETLAAPDVVGFLLSL